jgi:sterol desaturase/sphingolipid hydroxylase (fatty acid hydroxylase superfamily)
MAGADEATWGRVWEQLQVLFWTYAGSLGPAFSPLNIAATLGLCLILWLIWRPPVGFLAWVFPARVYRKPSFWVDVKLTGLNWFIDLFTTLNFAAVATLTAWAFGQVLGLSPPAPGDGSRVITALVVFMAGDLTLYWYHRLNHGRPVLWAFHALHHSAEEMSPVTAFRHHPLYSITAGLLVAVTVGLAQGTAMALVTGTLDMALLAGLNVFAAVLNLATNNLKHSHIWMRFPVWLEHILISPALHQVHHSIDPKHHDRNYGDVLALWDWMFGTLYIPKTDEVIRFGLGDRNGTPLPQRHPTLRAALVEPVARARALLQRRG